MGGGGLSTVLSKEEDSSYMFPIETVCNLVKDKKKNTDQYTMSSREAPNVCPV